LLEKGADHSVVDRFGISPFLVACFSGCSSLVKHYLEQDWAKVDEVDSTKQTGLHMAARNSHEEVMNILLKHNAKKTVTDKEGATPLHRAAAAHSADGLRCLLSHGLDIEARDSLGEQAIHKAAAAGQIEAVDELLKAGASIAAT
jgi:ankyrin repeat protein